MHKHRREAPERAAVIMGFEPGPGITGAGQGGRCPDEDPMLAAEAGEGTRRSRGEAGDFRVLWVAGGFRMRV